MEMITTEQQWEQWVSEGWNTLPLLVKSASARRLPPSWFHAWEQASPYSVVLESGKGGRYTYLGLRPESVLTGKGGQAEEIVMAGGGKEPGSRPDIHPGPENQDTGRYLHEGSPIEILRAWMAPYSAPRVDGEHLPPFLGGCIGFWSYDVVRFLERLPEQAADDPGFPDYLWMRLNEVWIYDHQEEALYCTVHAPAPDLKKPEAQRAGAVRNLYAAVHSRAEAMVSLWLTLEQTAPHRSRSGEAPEAPAAATGEWPGMATAFTRGRFEQAVLHVQEYIRQGDVFQVNLSLRQQAQLSSSPEEVYEWLRVLNPSPYMGLLRSPGFSLSSASPELLVKLHGDKVSARPIAGTRRRGRTPAEDQAMEAELRGNEKETAEHIMLVDLERNDIGRVAAYGSVRVPELMTVERYSHVMHLVSQVEGTIAEGQDAYGVMAALFPGGTITGAPKVRTMEIIEELEPVRRGPYTGSIGWIDYGGNMELNIIIRTLAVKDGIGYIQTGAGIVIDSDPYREYRECHNKAKAIVKAVLCSESGHGLHTEPEQEVLQGSRID